MTTYATYRHIELDKVGYGKKRVNHQSSDIFNVLCTPESQPASPQLNGGGNSTPRRSHGHNDSFNRLFGNQINGGTPSRKSSFNKHDVTTRNPVTGNGVTSWDQRKSLPKTRIERNPVTGETYTIVSPATTPTKIVQNGFSARNGHHEDVAAEIKAFVEKKPVTNGQA